MRRISSTSAIMRCGGEKEYEEPVLLDDKIPFSIKIISSPDMAGKLTSSAPERVPVLYLLSLGPVGKIMPLSYHLSLIYHPGESHRNLDRLYLS